MAIGVFVVDDHDIVRRGLRHLIEETDDLVVVGEASSGAEALARIACTRPDVAILDARLGDASGVEVCREIRSRHPEIRCLMLTAFADDKSVVSAVMAGAAGYLLKEAAGQALVDGIRAINAGRSLLDPSVTGAVLDQLRFGPREEDLLSRLTEQERRILDLIAEGCTNKQIAETLYLAEKTVKNYVSSLLTKLGMQRRSQAAAYVARSRAQPARPKGR